MLLEIAEMMDELFKWNVIKKGKLGMAINLHLFCAGTFHILYHLTLASMR